MRVLIAIIVIAAVLFFFGWLRYSSPEGNPTIQVDTKEVERDTSAVIEKSKQVIDKAADEVRQEGDEVTQQGEPAETR